jgi:CheY-like chemotaxis protein
VKPVTYRMLSETVHSFRFSSRGISRSPSFQIKESLKRTMDNEISSHFSVLVVEDDDITRWVLTTQLTSIGCQVYEACDGTSALQMMILGCSTGLHRRNFSLSSSQTALSLAEESDKNNESNDFLNLILMDCLLPEQDGFECTKLFRKYESKNLNNSKKPVPVIGLTADSTFHTRLKCLNSGMNECILKPASIETLINVLGKFAQFTPNEGVVVPQLN